MKKVYLFYVFIFIILSNISAQDRSSFKAGISAGVPVGDASNVSSFSVGLDVAYHWGVSELLDVGLATGFMNAFGDTKTDSFGPIPEGTGFEDFQFIPLAASFRIYPTYSFKLGADVGYAVGINEGNEGGFYYRPLVGYNITGNTELNVSYTAVDNNGTFAIATLGVLFLF
ncbi:hypothetical protein LV716_00715 [Flagellimonas sp. HMM57]|uniref:hypothetical protein n=1 Tax=unclassified Flagellimonas TaxID=2644544 RepID=UPI0013D7135F|nr:MULTISPECIES: hypothetical protein [unclassified Flagellimonas]UII76345.1 hypothetical protein LV716_00715 [Flagellimonas sp. HMM57]